MDFISSIKRNCTTTAYAQFSGRASRSEYWWFYLFTVLAGLAADAVGSTVGNLATLFFFLPGLALMVRRLHDVSDAPVILMGEEALPQKLQRWERVHSRILSWVGAEQATIADVDHLAKIYAPGLGLGQDMKEAVLKASRGSIRNVSTNLAHIGEEAATQGWRQVGLAEWNGRAMHTGEAPAPRHGIVAPRARVAGGRH